MSYRPAPFPTNKTLSMAGLQSWTMAQLQAVADAMPGRRVLDADQLVDNLPWDTGQDAVPALERMLKLVPPGAHVVFTRPGTLTIKQEWVPTSLLDTTIGGLWSSQYNPNATVLRYAASQNGGTAIFLRGCHEAGLEDLSIIGEGEEVLVEFDENVKYSGSRCFLRRCHLENTQGRASTLLAISRTATQNQEWHDIVTSSFVGTQESIYIGGRYDESDAGNIGAGSDLFTVNGPFIGEGMPRTGFTSKFVGWNVFIACGADGRTLHQTTVLEVLDSATVRLAAPAPLSAVNAYFCLSTARATGILIGPSANSLKHSIDERNEFYGLGVGIKCTGGSFHARRTIYGANVRNIEISGGAVMEPSCDEAPTCESSMQHLYCWSGGHSFEVKGPGRLALSTPMPATPFIAFGSGGMPYECDHVEFQDRELPLGSTVYDLSRAFDLSNQPMPGVVTNTQALLRCNSYNYPIEEIGLHIPFRGISHVRRIVDIEPARIVRDESIDATGVHGTWVDELGVHTA